MWFGQGHREQDPVPVPGRAKSPEAPQQNAEEAHRARGAPRGARHGKQRKKAHKLLYKKISIIAQ